MEVKNTEVPNERTRGNEIQGILFYCKGGQTLEHVAQRCYRPSILRNIQNQTGLGLEQPALVDSVLSGGLGLQDVQRSFPTSAILWFSQFYWLKRNYRWRRSNKSTLDTSTLFPQHTERWYPTTDVVLMSSTFSLFWSEITKNSQDWSVAKIIWKRLKWTNHEPQD